MFLTWDQYKHLNKDSGKSINEIAAEFTRYMQQNEDDYFVNRFIGTVDFYVQEQGGYALIQEGTNEYGLLQELNQTHE